MTKTKIKQAVIDNLQLFLEDNREEILDSIQCDLIENSDDEDSHSVDGDLVEEIYDHILDNLF